MKRKLQILTFLILFAFMTSSAFSQPGVGMRRWRGEDQCSRASELNLSPEQKKNLDLLQQTYFREAQLLRLEIFTKKLELRELLTNSTVRVEIIRGKNSEIAELQSKQEEKAIEYLIKVRNLLSPEQLRTWCPEQELPYFRQTMPGRRPMSPIHPE
ncbi:MAG: Spy/CpxP family protein refolding chaperone [Thermodesulfobacteriota bacterium]